GAVGLWRHAGDLVVVLVLDLADDLLENVLERNDAEIRAVLVDDDRDMLLAALKLAQLIEQSRRFRDEPGRGDARVDVHLVDVSKIGLQRAEDRLGVDDADDVVGLAPPHRDARIGARQDLAHELGGRQVAVDHLDLAAMGGDLPDLNVAEVENAAQHALLFARLGVGPLVQLDRAAQLVFADDEAAVRVDAGADELQCADRDELHRDGDRGQRDDHGADQGHDRERYLVRPIDRVGLGRHLRQDQDQHRHDHGGVDDARVAEDLDQHAGGERGCADVHRVVADQERSDQILLAGEQLVDGGGAVIALALQLVHAGAGDGGQGGFRTGEERGQDHQQGDAAHGDPK